MEVKGYKFQSIKEEKYIDDLCDAFMVENLDDTIVKKVIEIRKNRKIKLPDAIILATAVNRDQAIITRNTKDFINIYPSLKVIDPFSSGQGK